MNKLLIALLAFAPVLCFGDYTDLNSSSPCRLYVFKASSSGTFPTTTAAPNKPTTISDLFNHSLSSAFGISFKSSSGDLVHPKQSISSSLPTNRTYTVDYPVVSDSIYYCLEYACPQLYSLFSLASHAYADGNHFNSLRVAYSDSSNTYINFVPIDFVSELLTSTNSVYRSSVIRCLSTLPDINNSLSSIDRNLIILANRSTSDFDFSSLSNRLLAAQNLGLQNEMPVDVDTALDNLNLSNYDTSSPEFSAIYESMARSYDRALSAIETLSGLSAISVDPSSRSNLNDLLKQFGDSLSAGGAGHITTPLTNQMQRMSTDWVNETKAALSNNTQKIKDDLQAWKNQLHGTQTSIDNSAANIYNTLNNIAGGSTVVRVNVANQDIGVTITDPVTIDPTQFNSFSEDLGKAAEYMERLYTEFRHWYLFDENGWLKGFMHNFNEFLLPNVQTQLSVQQAISNLLANFAFNYTNNTEFAISNALAGFSFSSTNDFLLLSDYQSFIDSSKYIDVVSSLPDDLAAALSSFGFSDSSEYSGRWWVFQSANMALQSQLALTNAALSSTLLNALSAIDDSDDSGGSLLSRWLSLIDSLPDPEEIQQSLADATNIVSNICFERVDALYSAATQDLLSVVKGIYQDRSLPSTIRFVFIPAAEGREEKYVDIPVGDHSSLWSLFRSGMAFALSVVTLLLFPKYVSWLVSHYTRLVERIIKSLHAYSHQ